jgi:hypothetical protein
MNIKERYKLNKSLKVGDVCICPSCGSKFIKTNYQQAFCKTKSKTKCKDRYWNTVTPTKRNNTTRISPANAAWMSSRENRFNPEDYEHPFSCEGLGQWIDD